MIVVKVFINRGANRNGCTTWQLLFGIKLFNAISVERNTL